MDVRQTVNLMVESSSLSLPAIFECVVLAVTHRPSKSKCSVRIRAHSPIYSQCRQVVCRLVWGQKVECSIHSTETNFE
ncbi:hypothetical protein LAh9_104 [Aeromonas phage LAh_9]|uniref:Uncharacterized protein n=1 Tax=Aeromonas phage LAh_9 TaxID=2591033 RepID=A0A514A156_9CAUD|nr:hypothetical protein HWC32_gp105 [Aeromonas phage LAh_9]QDH46965.1 hypothetical protein LAh9_104 [Aeromonas phage LAh_9]